MLAGLQQQVDTLFPALRDLTPDESEIKAGIDKKLSGRVIKLSGYEAEIFDMHNAKERKAYAKRMRDLSERSQIGTVRILVHDRNVMHRKDGSTGWFSYLEWMEFARKEADGSVRNVQKKEGRNGKAR